MFTTEDLQLLRRYIKQSKYNIHSMTIEEVEHIEAAVEYELYAQNIKDFYKALNDAMPNDNLPLYDYDRAWDVFYDKDFTIGFGDKYVTIHNTAPVYDSIRIMLEELINDCL